ncbi:uncharacterized protein LOC110988890 [Acanthaster planci]|uniref:Uncharacterized protein LOC110988890 n=1 Tax=Acanthaster planci TaxID=133434 RepID=A0A8B7ZUR7_ACAPL|nr:uncharacterized protein LOC110988890 [Acanthaster planci]
MELVARLFAVMCSMHCTGIVMAQFSDLSGDLTDLGDILEGLNLGDLDIFGTAGEGPNEVKREKADPLTCYECSEFSEPIKNSRELAWSCAIPSKTTLNGSVCMAPPSGYVNRCGWIEATVSSPNPDNQEETLELYWIFRSCVLVPESLGIGDDCFSGDLEDTQNNLGLSIEKIVGVSGTISGEGCFCSKDYCNGVSTVRFQTVGAILGVATIVQSVIY